MRDAAPDRVVARAEEMRHQDVLGVHRRVRLELGPPVPVRELLAPEPLCARAMTTSPIAACYARLVDLGLDHALAPSCVGIRSLEPAHRLFERRAHRRLGQSRAREPRERCWRTGSRARCVRPRAARAGARGAVRITNASAYARPSATAYGIRMRGALRPEICGEQLEQLAHRQVRVARGCSARRAGRARTRASGPRRHRRRRRRSCRSRGTPGSARRGSRGSARRSASA